MRLSYFVAVIDADNDYTDREILISTGNIYLSHTLDTGNHYDQLFFWGVEMNPLCHPVK